MRQAEQAAGQDGVERRRVQAVVETLAALQGRGESLAEVAHDARNMVTALGLYCDLLEEPGVLAAPFHHYGDELRLVATASRRLVEKLVALDGQEAPDRKGTGIDHPRAGANPELATAATESGLFPSPGGDMRMWDLAPSTPVENLQAELAANRNLLAALAGPAIHLKLNSPRGALPVRMSGEDLTRVLVNLVKNAAEAMPAGGEIVLGLDELHPTAQAGTSLVLTVEDSGPGIPDDALEEVFQPGFSTRKPENSAHPGWAAAHRGLGLSISRSIVEAAGGRIRAANRAAGGARIEIELPVRAH